MMMDPADSEIDWDALGEEIFKGVDTEQASVVTLSDEDLRKRYHEAFLGLQRLRQIRHPRTQEGRDLHSVYGACVVELHRRNLL